jgi:hypothetical protein
VKKFNPVWLMIAFAALAQGVLWVNVFSLIHHGPLVYIGGIPAGLAIVGLVTYSANALPRVQSARARRGGWIMLTLTMIAEPIVLGVVNWWFMPADFRLSFGSYIVAGGTSLVISLVLVMGALVDRSLLPTEKPAPKPATETPKPARNPKKVAEKRLQQPITDEQLLSYFAGNTGATNTDAAQHFGVTRQAIGKRVKKLYEVKQ